MKIIELLNKIANGEEVPKEIKYKGHIYKYQYEDVKEANIINYYYSEENHRHLIDGGYHDIRLNDEVEIIEEDKKIEKIPSNYYLEDDEVIKDIFYRKINAIIEELNGRN